MIKEYNGWTNYATWKVKLEMFDNWDSDSDKVTPELLKQWTEDEIYEEVDHDNSIAACYALAFISDVNWHEIAKSLNSEEE
jgi:hypothetical protein|tara:strand:- start:122 stop:364 length:243 start_codon:yes stop_codon:yes gene_type:complete